MPYINIKLAGVTLPPPQREDLLARITDLMGAVMKKRREVTVVSLEEADRSHWAVAGRVLSAVDRPAAYVEIKVTAGTNTPEEKAAMINETMAALKSVAGEIQTATYVVIHDVAADSWGYDGVTQAARRQAEERVMTSMRRTAGGAVDTEFYRQQAQRLRACFVGQLWHRLFAATAGFVRRVTNNRWRERRIKKWSRCEN